ncbi:hypothetical protein Csa_020352 [Cucumis sativus]|uniref:Uncharacterized protein n=1 Tax=Cucumis sativus TaxID=3659 RepID=A0A0A0K0P4_CUCSA|nr:hypothetical protein Csa_020352 [Cucumis sativus]
MVSLFFLYCSLALTTIDCLCKKLYSEYSNGGINPNLNLKPPAMAMDSVKMVTMNIEREGREEAQ